MWDQRGTFNVVPGLRRKTNILARRRSVPWSVIREVAGKVNLEGLKRPRLKVRALLIKIHCVHCCFRACWHSNLNPVFDLHLRNGNFSNNGSIRNDWRRPSRTNSSNSLREPQRCCSTFWTRIIVGFCWNILQVNLRSYTNGIPLSGPYNIAFQDKWLVVSRFHRNLRARDLLPLTPKDPEKQARDRIAEAW